MNHYGKHISAPNYEFYDPRVRKLQHDKHIQIINKFGLI